jgi:CubicO group peptidase (beta-lactamase class C family)
VPTFRIYSAILLVAIAAMAVVRQEQRDDAGFPGASWEAASALEALGWSSDKINALKPRIDAVGSSAFMIVTRGKVVAAWGDTSKTFLTHSIRKSFMSALYGMAVAEGRIDIQRTIGSLGVTEKSVTLTAAEQQARLVDLLKARSGVYIPAAGEVESMSAERPARGSHTPGTFWYYNNWDFNVLGSVYRQLTGEDIFEAIERRIAQPIGMQDFRVSEGQYYLEDSSAHPGYIFRISARDLARFGHLYLHKGRWRGSQVIPASWVDASLRSYSTVTGNQASRATKTGYGYMWWLQINAAKRPELRIPDGTFTASGYGGQRLTVVPQTDTVIVNLMNTDDETGPRLGNWDDLLAEVLAARR